MVSAAGDGGLGKFCCKSCSARLADRRRAGEPEREFQRRREIGLPAGCETGQGMRLAKGGRNIKQGGFVVGAGRVSTFPG